MKLSILFWLRASAANSKGEAPLKIRLTLPNNDITNFSSGLVCNIKYWNKNNKKVSGTSKEAARVNLYISRSTTKLKDIYDDLARDGRYISTEVIKTLFTGKAQSRLTILNLIKEHNTQFRETITITGTGCESTAKKFELLSVKLARFLNERYDRKDYFVNEIDYSFVQDFRNWLLMYGSYKSGPLAHDSVIGHLKKCRKICLNLFKRGLIKNDPFIDTKLRWGKSTAEGLTESDLQKLMDLSVLQPMQQKVLDRFIVGSFSGLAHSDLSSCKRDDLVKNFGNDQLWIKVKRKKTGEICKIAVLPPVQAIIDKYWNDRECINENKLFPSVGLNFFNICIKKLATAAGISAEVALKVSSHTSRHSHAQQLLNYGVSIHTVSEILGHSGISITKKVYARNSFFFVAEDMKKYTEKRFPKNEDGKI